MSLWLSQCRNRSVGRCVGRRVVGGCRIAIARYTQRPHAMQWVSAGTEQGKAVQQDDSSSKLKQQQQQQQHPTRLPHGLQMCGRPELYHLKQSCCYPSRKLPGVVLPGGAGVTSVVGACIHVGGARVAPPGQVLLPLVPVAGQLLFCWSVVCEPASRGAGRPGLLICTKAWGPCPGVWCTEYILSASYRVAREQLVLLLEPSCCCPG